MADRELRHSVQQSRSQSLIRLKGAHYHRLLLAVFTLMLLAGKNLHAAQICDGVVCDTSQSLEALKQYEATVDQWVHRPSNPNDLGFPPHFGGLPLSARDKRRAEDYIDVWWLEYTREAAFQQTHPGDNQPGYPSFQSALFHSIGSLYGKLTPDDIGSIATPPGKALWNDDDTRSLMETIGISGPNVLAFLDGLKYGDYGVKLYLAKNFRLTRQQNLNALKLSIVADYAFDVATQESQTNNVVEDDLLAAKLIADHIPIDPILTSHYISYYDGMLAEINGAVLERELVAEGRLSFPSTVVAIYSSQTRNRVPASQTTLRSKAIQTSTSTDVNSLISFADRVYSQFIASASDLAVMGEGAKLYAPWTDADTDQILALIGAKFPAALPLLKAYAAGKLVGTEMVVKNDPGLRLIPEFRLHVEEALLVEWVLGQLLDKAGEKTETSPFGSATSYAAVVEHLRQEYLLKLSPDEQTYMSKLNEAVDFTSLASRALGSPQEH